MQNSSLLEIIERFPGVPLAVVGDLILDEFVWGRVERISPEAPVPVVEVQRESVHPGGAANVAANLAALGARPMLVGVIGSDMPGSLFLQELQRLHIDPARVVLDAERETTRKTRIIAHHQQVCRADRESRKPLSSSTRHRLEEMCRQALQASQGLILSDYLKGTLDRKLIQTLIEEARQQKKFVAVDPKVPRFQLYRGASIITPNKKEAELASGISIQDEPSLLKAGRKLLRLASSPALLITRGEEGMTLFEGSRHLHIPTVAQEVFDVTGAGDTVVAALALAAAVGAPLPAAARLANHAAGIVVGKLGTATVSCEELIRSLSASRLEN